MIDLYDSNLDNLMDGVKVSGESKFNDTPQNVQGTYDFDDDDHLSTITRNETVSDNNTRIMRLTEIQQNLKDLYSDFAMEFKELFIYE